MYPSRFHYEAPSSIDEALQLLSVYQGEAKVLSGGMSLIPLMKLRLAWPENVIDLGRIPGLNQITESGSVVKIGAMATHHAVESSPLIRGKCPLLSETAGNIGDVQVRNMGTIGGSVAHADPSADYPAALQALEAKIVLKGAKSERTVSADDFLPLSTGTASQSSEMDS